MNPEKEPTTTTNLPAVTTSFGSAASLINSTSSTSSLSSSTTTSMMTAQASTSIKHPEVDLHNLSSVSIIPTSSKLSLSSNSRPSLLPIHTTPTIKAGAMQLNPLPTASLIKIDRTTLTPISKLSKIKQQLPTSMANSITITAKSANGSSGQGRTIVNSSSILSDAVAAAAASKPKILPANTSSIPSGTTITKINSSTGGNGNKIRGSPLMKPIGGWKETALPNPVMNKDVFSVQSQSQLSNIISIYDPATKATQYNTRIQTVINAPPSITICEPKPAPPLLFAGAPLKAPPSHLKFLNQYMASAGKLNHQTPPVPPMPTLVSPQVTRPTITHSHELNKAIISNSIINRSATSSVQLMPTTIAETPKPNDSIQEPMINVQISNGMLSDRQGPIRMLTGESTPPPIVGQGSNVMNVVSIIPIHSNYVPSPVTVSFAPASNLDPKPTPTTPTNEQKRQILMSHLQKSPRLQNRSRSLGVSQANGGHIQRKRRPRCRIPSEPLLISSLQMPEACRGKTNAPPAGETNDNNLQAPPPTSVGPALPVATNNHTTANSNVIDIEISNLSKICDSLFDTLECPEQMDDKSSTKSKTVTPEKPEEKIDPLEAKTLPFNPKPKMNLMPSHLIGQKRCYKDPMKMIHWKQGIGYLPASSLFYQTNEFLLIEPAIQSNVLAKIDPSFQQRVNNVALLKATKSRNLCRLSFSVNPSTTPPQPTNTLAAALSGTPITASSFNVPSNRPQQSLLRSLMSKNSQPSNQNNITSSNSNLNTQMFNIPVRSIPFSWDIYLQMTNSTAAPKDVFLNPFPSTLNPFEVGMKLECIDPLNSSRICVCTIVHVVGYRLKIHFDGHSPQFAFWCNADSQDIFPAGWCGKTGRKLTPPPNTPLNTAFDWRTYLTQTNSGAASRTIFTHLNSTTTGNRFRRGMKLEADDLRNSRKICVATVADVLDNRILITFDGWDEQYDYWVEINSPFIHPVNWHLDNGFNITAPPDYPRHFKWETYIVETKSEVAPKNAFAPRSPMGFKIGMKLEMVDKKNPSLIRPSTVVGIDDYEVRVLFDGWPDYYAYWMADDHPDLHPVKWCERTEHPLEPTPSAPKYSRNHACGIPACRGIGNANHYDDSIHLHAVDCPYTLENWRQSPPLNRLLEYEEIVQNMRKRTKDVIQNKPMKSPEKQKYEFKRIKLHRPELPVEPQPDSAKTPKVERPTTPVLIMLENENTIKLELMSEDSCEADPTRPDEVVAASPPQPTPIKAEPLAEDEMERRVAASDHILRDYVPTLYGNYQLWRQNSRHLFRYVAEGEDSIRTSNPLAWTVQDVAKRVSELPGCSQLATRFEENEIDGNSLLMLSQDDLIETTLRLRRGQAIKVFNYIALLREEVSVRWLIQ